MIHYFKMLNNSFHEPILVNPFLDHVNLLNSSVMIDATLGFAGHASAILSQFPEMHYIGFDRDPFAIQKAKERCSDYPNFHVKHGSYSQMIPYINSHDIKPTHILMDLGISSYQLDQSNRGFSFQRNEPLDMRMNPSDGKSAADILQTYSETAIAEMIRTGGDIRGANRLAATIVSMRELRPILSTFDLIDCIKKSIICRSRREFIALTTRIFQAIRIEVNHELDELKITLNGLLALGIPIRVAVITFQPNEDRWVKQFMKTEGVTPFRKKPFKESYHACKKNPRAKSALMRLFCLNDSLRVNS